MAPNGLQRTFATVLNCMDGRVQLGVNRVVREVFGVDYVDTITEAGIVKFVSDRTDAPEAKAAIGSVRVSMEAHGSRGVAVAAHHDCAGNPCDDEVQIEQLRRAVAYLQANFPTMRVVGLWVAGDGEVSVEIPASPAEPD